ncbi:MAG: pseudouridine synthase [Planctomycetota bacterium]|nr:pseudouridine synthase [Planctomycetota bacterium]MDA1177653.1 pseudouridine synthase [Planctomycetota bacterium]
MSARKNPTSPRKPNQGGGERLQKILAAAGIASRRECEALILDGRVEIDRKVVKELGARVDPSRQEIRLDGETLKKTRRVYYLVHKPVGFVSTHRDPANRPRVIDLVGASERLFTVGRLDLDSSGLILVTNDGDLANLLAHPRYEVPKIYRVLVAGQPTPEVIAELRKGVYLAEGKVKPRQVVVRRVSARSTLLEILLTEGRNREIRRMMARVGHKVLQLIRIGFGTLRLGELPAGEFRMLTPAEVQSLRESPADVRPLRAKKIVDRTPRRSVSKTSDSGSPRTDSASKGDGPRATVIGARSKVVGSRPKNAVGARSHSGSTAKGVGRPPKKGSRKPGTGRTSARKRK